MNEEGKLDDVTWSEERFKYEGDSKERIIKYDTNTFRWNRGFENNAVGPTVVKKFDGRAWAYSRVINPETKITSWQVNYKEKTANNANLKEVEERERNIPALLFAGRAVMTDRRICQFSYPWIMYRGFSPNDNELIIANLADST